MIQNALPCLMGDGILHTYVEKGIVLRAMLLVSRALEWSIKCLKIALSSLDMTGSVRVSDKGVHIGNRQPTVVQTRGGQKL